MDKTSYGSPCAHHVCAHLPINVRIKLVSVNWINLDGPELFPLEPNAAQPQSTGILLPRTRPAQAYKEREGGFEGPLQSSFMHSP